ncbi:excalibur calcium-binding domain-containing protein [Hypericibacter sp.]|uniref:excalibur calcium-binding domain-containing protein n=1 Tax=Hypericibacter sp. TaxID=2705401 RepID=UPI003D6D4D0F
MLVIDRGLRGSVHRTRPGTARIERLGAAYGVEAPGRRIELRRSSSCRPRAGEARRAGYWPQHDRDGDGIACEPWLRR